VTGNSPASSRRIGGFARIRIQTGPAPIAIAIAALILLRFAASAVLPLSADEAYYWLWSKHLAAGYLDHPPAIAWRIRFGTAIFGDTSFGVRSGATLSSTVATWSVWRAGAEFLRDELAGARAALWFNLTLMVTVEALAATPDAPALLASAALLFALVRVNETSDGRWWIAVGVAGGFGMLSKFTMVFLAAGVVGWLVLDPRARRWWITPWPYMAVLVATLLYLPNLLWNAGHDWSTYAFQFGRVGRGHFAPRFLVEFVLAQVGLCSPFIVLLGVMGIWRATRREELRLIAMLLLPGIAYFVVHALHDRVQANWPSFLLPALCIAALLATRAEWAGFAQSVVVLSRRAAVPVAAMILALAYFQALFGIIPVGRSDPLTRLLGLGVKDVAERVDTVRAQSGMRAVLTTDYESAAWLSFYLPSHPPIIALGEPERWTFAPEAGAALLAGPLLYVAEAKLDRHEMLASQFGRIVPLGKIDRTRGGILVAHYGTYRVSDFRGQVAGRVLP